MRASVLSVSPFLIEPCDLNGVPTRVLYLPASTSMEVVAGGWDDRYHMGLWIPGLHLRKSFIDKGFCRARVCG
jgi:hypothetical protein